MQNVVGAIRYALRQFWFSKVFSVAAVLTLALGIGGTTAIFTLIHAVMLRSLPVADPASLYRIGDGDNCCVQGGPQDQWGMFSFPLFERLKAASPEFEQMTAFQASGSRSSVRRQGDSGAARPLRTEYVTGNYFTTIGVAPPGFFGETLRGNPPDVWIPLQHEPLIAGNGLLRQPVSAWLRVIGRLKPGASIDGVAPRLTGILRQWMVNDSGYPANWMPDVQQGLPKQVINVVPAGAGVGVMKAQYGQSLKLLLAVCGLVLLIA